MNIFLRSSWFVSAGRYLFSELFLTDKKSEQNFNKNCPHEKTAEIYLIALPWFSIYKLFQRILSRLYWLKYRENDRDRVSPFTPLSLLCHPIQILNHFHYWSKSTPTFNTWFFQFWLNARFFPNPMFPIPAEKETDSWMVAHTKTTAIKKPRRFICKIVRFSSLTFD